VNRIPVAVRLYQKIRHYRHILTFFVGAVPAVLSALVGLAATAGPEQPLVMRIADPAESVAFSADGQILAAAGDHGRVHLLHVPPPGEPRPASAELDTPPLASPSPLLGTLHARACELRRPRFGPTGLNYYGSRYDCGLSGGTQSGIPVYDAAEARVVRRLGPHAGYLRAIRISIGGERLAAASDDGQVRVWSLADGRLLRQSRLPRLTDPRRLSLPFAFDPTLELLAVHDWRDYYMSIVEVAGGRVLHRSEYPFRAIDQPLFVFAPDGGSYFDGRRIRASRSGAPVGAVEFNFALIPYRAAFSPTGDRLALLQRAPDATSTTVEIYRVATGALWSSYTVADRLEDLAWHPDPARDLLAAGAYSGRIYLREFE
jgi:hypothetical protein